MSWRSPQTPINRHERIDDPNPFPMFVWPRGRNWVWYVSDELIFMWEKREAELSRNRRIARLKLPHGKHSNMLQRDLTNGHRDWTLETLKNGERKRAHEKNDSQKDLTRSVETKNPSPLTLLATRYADSFFEKRKRKL